MKRALLLACLIALPGGVAAQTPGITSRVGTAADAAFRDCRTWCQVRIEGARAIPSHDTHGPGMKRPELWLAVRVRNVGPDAATLGPDELGFQATAADLPQMGDIAIADGPWPEPRIAATRPTPVIEPGQSVLVHYRFWRLPDQVRGFHLKAGGQFALGAQAWAAAPLVEDFVELERNLFLEGNLSYIPSHVPAPARADDFVGEWDREGRRIVVTREANKIVVRALHEHGAVQNTWEFGATPHPARLITPESGTSRIFMSHDPRGYLQIGWDQQTLQMSAAAGSGTANWTARRIAAGGGGSGEPGPTPPVGSSGGSPQPSPGSSSAAGFQTLGGFGVRFDRLERPRSGGVVRAVVTLRNDTQQVQHLPSGTFRAILTDADGAGQERNQLWRGSGEPAQLFNGTPALQPGGELTVRFTFNPDIRALDSLILMRGQEQVEFDLGGR